MSKKLLNDEIVSAYRKRLEKMKKYMFTKKGDEIFITTLVAEAEQLKNLHIRTKVNGFEIECDEPEELGGTNNAPNPVQLLLASLANCLEISALLYSTFAKLAINSLKVKIEATYDKRSVLADKQAPLPGFYNYKVTWYIDTEENIRKIERVLKKVEKNCAVRGSLENPKKFEENIVLLSKNQ